jgi:hypothetical protein
MVWADVAEAQCAMCRTAFASDEGRQLIAAFRSGILFLLAAPFVTFGTVALLAVRARGSRSLGQERSDCTEHELTSTQPKHVAGD